MSYAIQPPAATQPAYAPGPPRRPVPVTLAAVVLTVMAVVGLAYAIATVSTAPGTVSRFRDAAAGAATADIDGYVSVIWIGAAIGTVLAVILVALFVVLAFGLRRGSNAARIATWVVCALGLLAGLASTITVLVQRSGDGDPQSLGAALTDSYPTSWIGLNLGLAIAQMVGYVVVALLLLAARGAWFGRGPATPAPPQPGYAPAGYGAPGNAPAGYGAPGNAPTGYGAPGYAPPGNAGATGGPDYGAPYANPQSPGYGAPAGSPQGPPNGYPATPEAQGYGVAPSTQGHPGPTTPSAQSHGPNAQSYGADPNVSASGYGYGGPYDQGQPQASGPGHHPAPDQAHQPTPGSPWAPPPGHGGQPPAASQQSPVPPFGMPVVNHTVDDVPAPTEKPQPGPDDEFWSRPPS